MVKNSRIFYVLSLLFACSILLGCSKSEDPEPEIPDAVLFFEVPNVLYTLRDMGIWDLIYEHFSYFNSFSITNLFRRSGFEVLDVYETYDSQFLCLEARLDEDNENSELLVSEEIAGYVHRFQKQYIDKKEAFAAELNGIKEKNLKAIL